MPKSSKSCTRPIFATGGWPQGADPVGSTPDELAAFVKTELVKYAKIVKDSGVRPD